LRIAFCNVEIHMNLFVLVHFPNDECRSMTPPDKPPRSMSQTKASGRKSRSSFIRRKPSKNDESKWYIETTNINNNNNNNNNNNHEASTTSTPIIDRSSRKLGKTKNKNQLNPVLYLSSSSEYR